MAAGAALVCIAFIIFSLYVYGMAAGFYSQVKTELLMKAPELTH